MGVETNITIGTNIDTGADVEQEIEVTADAEVKTEAGTEMKVEHDANIMIPKKRFDEVNTKYKELTSQVEEFQKAKEMLEQQLKEIQEKAETTTTSITKEKEEMKEKLNNYKTLVSSMVEEKVKSIPPELQELIPEGLTIEQKLTWLTKAEEKGLFKKHIQPVEIGKPLNHSLEMDKQERLKKLNPLQLLTTYYSDK